MPDMQSVTGWRGGFRAIRDVLSQTGDAAVKHEQQALDLAKAGKVDVKDFESRLSLYQQHKPYRIAAKH